MSGGGVYSLARGPHPIGLLPRWEVWTFCSSASRVSLMDLLYIGTPWVGLSGLLRQGTSLRELLKK